MNFIKKSSHIHSLYMEIYGNAEIGWKTTLKLYSNAIFALYSIKCSILQMIAKKVFSSDFIFYLIFFSFQFLRNENGKKVYVL